MQSAFGVEHGDEVSKGFGDIPRAFMAGAKGGRNLARGHQVATLGGKAAQSVARAPKSAQAGTRVGGMFGRGPVASGGANSRRLGPPMRPKAFAAPQHGTPVPQPGNALAVIPKPAAAAQKKTPWGKYSLIGGGGAAAGAGGMSMYNRRNS